MSITLDEVIKKLKRYGCSLTNDNGAFVAGQNALYSGDYTAQSIKRAHLENCMLKNAIFDDAAVTGSAFFGCTFIECRMSKADFEYCNFENCEFINTPLLDESYNNSTFYNTKFFNSPFYSCTLTGTLFKKVLISDAVIEHCTLEGAIFENCKFKKMDLSHLNMEFVELNNIQMDDVILPSTQIPYILGGVEYVVKTTDNIKISANNGKTINKKKYIDEVIPLLCEYYQEKKAHFPLVNIYLGLGDKPQAYRHLKIGMQNSVISKDFRMLKYFCKLAARSNVFKYKELNNLYDSIQKFIPIDTLNQQELHNYSTHIGEIKTILFSRQDMPKVSFTIRTNIEPNNMDPLSQFVETLFSIKQKICNQSDMVQLVLEQNSPFIITLNITGELFDLCCFVLIVVKLINESQELYSKYWDYICDFDTCRQEYITNTILPLLKLAEEKSAVYISTNVLFSISEIWFNNIESQNNLLLQYVNTGRLAIMENH